MSEALGIGIISFPVASGDWGGSPDYGHVFRAPGDGAGGGLTITEAYFVNTAATGAGTGFSLSLENWGTAGTAIKAAAAGTVAAPIGGTGAVWAADTAKDFTLSLPFIDGGEYVVLRKTEVNASDPAGTLVIHYTMGR